MPRSVLLRSVAFAGLLSLVAGACSGDSDDANSSPDTASASSSPPATTAPPTTAPATSPPTTVAASTVPSTAAPTTVPATTVPADTTSTSQALMVDVVGTLASDEYEGRNENTEGWRLSQEYLAAQLAEFAEPIAPDAEGVEQYLQHTRASVNILGVIPGSDLPDEYVVIGAHYDHLGDGDCPTTNPTDTVCNGANDNAAGVAVALAAARQLADSGVAPRRSVIVAFWDREEDALEGSSDFLIDPIVPLEQIVGYINFDIQGANLLPALRETTVMVGAETGGQALVDAAQRATAASSLSTVALSLIFGQGRSDHAPFVRAGIPSVFFTDANNGCYHTSQDDISIVDFDKLDQQFNTAAALLADLADTDQLPVLVTDAPLATYADAVSMLGIVTTGQPDLDMLPPDRQAAADTYLTNLQTIVTDGPGAFDDADIGTVLAGAADLVDALSLAACDGYLPAG